MDGAGLGAPLTEEDTKVGALLTDGQMARSNGKIVLEILIGGQSGVGKTTLAKAWSAGKAYDAATDKTPLMDCFTSELVVPDQDGGDDVHLEYRAYDVAGHDRFGKGSAVTAGVVRQSRLFMIVFDVSKPETFTDALEWKQNLEAKGAMAGVKWMLVMSKIDLIATENLDSNWLTRNYNGVLDPADLGVINQQRTSANQIIFNYIDVFSRAATRHGFNTFFPVSAHSFVGIAQAFDWAWAKAKTHLQEYDFIFSVLDNVF